MHYRNEQTDEKKQKEKEFEEYCDAHEEELLEKILNEARRLELLDD